jgi:organic radical activating enzyme
MIKLVEFFYSIQTEGTWSGTPAVFFRLTGCNRDCSFCDTPEKDEANHFFEPADFLNTARQFPTKMIVITGGEPLMHYGELVPALQLLKEHGYIVSLETNGTIDLPDWEWDEELELFLSPTGESHDEAPHPHGFAFVCVSPKDIDSWVLRKRIDAVKVVYWRQDISEYEKVIQEELWKGWDNTVPFLRHPEAYLQPRWMEGEEKENQEMILETINYAQANPMWRLSIQWHKMIGIQ